jgi:hypothetical protein
MRLKQFNFKKGTKKVNSRQPLILVTLVMNLELTLYNENHKKITKKNSKKG